MHQSPGVPQLHPALAWNREDTASSKEPREAACFEQLKWTNGKELPFWESNMVFWKIAHWRF